MRQLAFEILGAEAQRGGQRGVPERLMDEGPPRPSADVLQQCQ